MTSTGTIQNNHNTTELLNYLKKDSKQYPPLNKVQERELIEKYRNNRDELNRLLYMHNIRLVFNMAKKYASKTNDFDSLVSDGLYGLSVACQRFDVDMGIKFSTYATNWVFKYCLSSFYGKNIDVEKNSTSLNAASLCANLKSNNGNEITLENYVNEYIDPTCNNQKTFEHELSAIEHTDICKHLIDSMNTDSNLSAVDKAVFIDSFYHREKTKDIAKKFDITVQNVNQIKSKILSKFKTILNNEYHIKSIEDINLQ